MSMRFRKTIKLGKGVNLNFNKNSVGSKAGRITVNSLHIDLWTVWNRMDL